MEKAAAKAAAKAAVGVAGAAAEAAGVTSTGTITLPDEKVDVESGDWVLDI